MYSSVTRSNTLVGLLEWRNENQPTDLAYEFIHDLATIDKITYRQLALKARAIAVKMTDLGVVVGDRALLIYPPGLELIAAYFGCLYAGVIAIPVYPPLNMKQINKLKYIVADSQPKMCLSISQFSPKLPEIMTLFRAGSCCLTTDNLDKSLADCWSPPDIVPDSLAFIQYTSGSTSDPKGVQVSHKNLMHNLELLYQGFHFAEIDHMVSWLPPFHDMGLISGILLPMWKGKKAFLMAPMSFLQTPFLWLKVISNCTTAISGAPNFAFDYCVKRISQEQKKELDLSRWLTSYNGAEPVRFQSLQDFTAYFFECGFRKESFYPCYGMAEATLIVSGKYRYTEHAALYLDKEGYKMRKVIIDMAKESVIPVVSCGEMYQNVCIVDPKTCERSKKDDIGEIWVESDSVCQGYWKKRALTKQIFQAQIKNDNSQKKYLRTGDLGFIYQNELYITGRIKDVMIIHGKNYYPQDIEFAAEHSHPLLRKGCSIAFSIEKNNSEHLVIVCESNATNQDEWLMLVDTICLAVGKEFELVPCSIVFITPKTLPKTTSGKVRRQPCKKGLIAGELAIEYQWFSPSFDGQEGCVIVPTSASLDYKEWIITWIAKHIHQEKSSIISSKPWIEYGLDSIAMMQLIHDLSEQSGRVLESVLAWEYDTPETLATYLSSDSVISKPTLAQLERNNSVYQLSPSQERLWFMQQLSPQQPMFNIGCVYKFSHTKLNFFQLKQACEVVTDRHQILRTAITMIDGKPVPIILPNLMSLLSIIDSTEEDSEDSIKNCLIRETMKPYHLEEGNLIRFCLVTNDKKGCYFLVAAHHMISDGRSLSLIMKEIISLYENDAKISLPAVQQYYDFSPWLHQRFDQNSMNKTMDFWVNYLTDAPKLIALSTAKPREYGQVAQIRTYSLKLTRSLSRKIEAFCLQERITPFIYFLTAYQLLLMHHSTHKEVIVGVPVSDRSLPGTKDAIGFFINTIPIRLQISGEETVRELISNNFENIKKCFRHQSLPLASLLSALKIERDISYEPLFQVLFVMQNNFASKIEGSHVQGELFWGESGQLGYDLALEIIPREHSEGNYYQVQLKYNENLFASDTIAAMVNQLKILSANLIKSRDSLALQVPLLSASLRQQLLVNWNDSKTHYPLPNTIHEMFEGQVKKKAAAIALIIDEEEISYNTLNESANRLARYLREQMGEQIGIVAISQRRSLGLIVSFLATLKAGCAYIYIDPDLPLANQQIMLADSNAKLLLNDYRPEFFQHYSGENLNLSVPSNDLAYIVYTSGTTGVPKGVLIAHSQISDRLHWYIETPIDTAGFLHLFSFSFDGGIVALWWPLLGGGTVILSRNLREPALNADVKKAVTTLHLTPSLLAGILSVAQEFPALKDIVLAGESFHVRLLKQIKDAFKGASLRIWNLYGVSECAVISCCYQVKGDEVNTIPIGKPITNTSCFVLDEYQQPVPIGVAGELYIGGNAVSQGYLSRPELTHEKFINLCFDNQPPQRAYRTGDWVRWNKQGELEYICRIDKQIKLRGYRIELAGIEAVLRGHPAVKDVVVTLLNGISERKQLAAYIVPEAKTNFELENIKKYANQYVVQYMIPEIWVMIERMPLTPNGKIDLLKLPQPEITLAKNAEIAQTEIEKKLTIIWGEVLKIPHEFIDIKEDFFSLGGDSIVSIQLIMHCNQQGYQISLNDLYTHKTIKKLAILINAQQHKIEKNAEHKSQTLSQRIANHCCTSADNIDLQGMGNVPVEGGMIIATNHLHWWHLMRVYPYLLMAIHQSDKPYLLSAAAIKFLYPLSRLFFHPIYLNRHSMQKDFQVLGQCVDYLKHGQTLFISPEGTRNHGSLIKAKNGVAYLAYQSHMPVVPIAIYKEKSNEGKFHAAKWHINIGEAINHFPDCLDKRNLDDFTHQLMSAISLLLPENRRGKYRTS